MSHYTQPRSTISSSVTRCAVYCRVSSSGQEDNSSLATQDASCRAYAAERGWTVVAVHREVHTGAELFERPELTRLREAMRRGDFDVLLVHALDRLSRKQTHQGLVLSEAEHAGVAWDSATEDIDDSPQGQILRAVIGGMAEMERLKIAERTVRGRKARAESGKLLPGTRPPYGYQWRDDTKASLDIDPQTGPIIRSAFCSIAAGDSLHGMVRHWRSVGIPTATGTGTWHAATLRDMLQKSLYCGRAFAWGWRKRVAGKPQQFDEEKAIPLPPGTVPAIVSEEVWEAVQSRLALNRQQSIRNAKDPESALLRGGYLTCGICGRNVIARKRSNGKTDYVCSRGRGLGECPGGFIVTHRLDEAVWSRVKAILVRPETVAQEVERLRRSDPTSGDLSVIARSLTEVERQRANVARAMALIDDEETMAPLAGQLAMLKDRRTALLDEENAIRTRKAAWQESQLALDGLGRWCSTVAENVDSMTWAEKRLAMDALGVHATLYPDGHEPRFLIAADIPLDPVLRTT